MRITLKNDRIDGFAKAIEEELADWDEHKKTAQIPTGKEYAVDVLTTGSDTAIELPESVFDCRRDSRLEVVREVTE